MFIIKSLLTIFITLSFAHATNHQAIEKKWLSVSKEFNLDPNEHGFCYIYQDKVYGKNAHLKARLASTSKPITSLMALETLGPNFQYETKIYSNGSSIHLEGSNDGMFSEEKIFYLIAALNANAITNLDTISFDENTPIFAIALRPYMSMSEAWYSKEYNIEQLQEYFNLSRNKKIQTRLKEFLQKTGEDRLRELGLPLKASAYKMRVDNVIFTNTNPLKDIKSTYLIKSPRLLNYLKFQNSVSHNWLSDITYKSYGAEKFSSWFLQNLVEEKLGNDYYQKRIGFSENEANVKLYTGSGLDSKIDGNRVDNYATCAIVLSSYIELENSLHQSGNSLEHTLPIAGIDIGTLSKRLNSQRNKGAILAKTGTLMNTKSLSGKISTQKGPVFFGYFHHVFKANGRDQYNAKIVQDLMTEFMIEEFGGAKKIKNYIKPKPFIPLEGTVEEI
ncbi:D-Ala-D-Ala carboxypeptidase 3 (S13) domain protein [Bacteriovorax sp. BAL6_X]|uniref:D-alanyl-D-alanine carboxypeptidase n=1 Tax=Bacteriovorax sp. BAL6_X TaxID=1201290 RepID=UPI000386CD5E|nr:D-alanyl-D-alanine carboxypeptidase [Bacteriovorax sp. BAL6_X]EPZ50620.1 D-Ala-D-Ala carboxypeptidase 3 (S13) domain protein [Bacteriovorax sp. BAL6_X]